MLDGFQMFHNQLLAAGLAKFINIQSIHEPHRPRLRRRYQFSMIKGDRINRYAAIYLLYPQFQMMFTDNTLFEHGELTLE